MFVDQSYFFIFFDIYEMTKNHWCYFVINHMLWLQFAAFCYKFFPILYLCYMLIIERFKQKANSFCFWSCSIGQCNSKMAYVITSLTNKTFFFLRVINIKKRRFWARFGSILYALTFLLACSYYWHPVLLKISFYHI